MLDVELDPQDPKACPEAVRAITEADWVVLRPGSWYSSVIPHVLVPELRAALSSTRGRVVVNLNLEPQPGETDGLGPAEHLEVLLRHAPDLRIDTVLADVGSVPDPEELRSYTDRIGAELVLADVARVGAGGQHDPEKLARAYAVLVGVKQGP